MGCILIAQTMIDFQDMIHQVDKDGTVSLDFLDFLMMICLKSFFCEVFYFLTIITYKELFLVFVLYPPQIPVRLMSSAPSFFP